jgi:hypothetical protein
MRRRLAATGAVLAAAAMVAISLPTAAFAAADDSQKIVAHVDDLRTSGGLAGVTMRLYTADGDNSDAPRTAVTEPWGTCVSVADGTCTFTVPNAGRDGQFGDRGENYQKSFWVVQQQAPDGYYLNPSLITGNNTSDSWNSERFAQTPYVYRTPALNGGGDIDLPSTSWMPRNSALGTPINDDKSTDDRWDTSGDFAVSVDNNRYQAQCTTGPTVAILIDLSYSMHNNNDEGIKGAKAAAKQFVASLKDTGSRVTLYTFGTDAPKNNSSSGRNYPTPVLVDASGAATLNDRIDDYNADDIQYTNWDRGLNQLVGQNIDIAVVLTDGNPTRFGTRDASGAWTTNEHVEEAIFSANALKKDGAQVFAFGVGEGISTVPGDNLRAVSGPVEWDGQSSTVATSDYFKTNDWAKVASGLNSLAKSVTCAATIEIQKVERLAGETEQPGKGWSFTATKASGSGTLSTPSEKQTDAQGLAEWSLAFTAENQTGSVTVTEDLASKDGGWSLAGIVCSNKGVPFSVPQTLPIQLTGLGVGDYVKCVVTNELPRAASVTVDKKWVVDGAAAVANGDQPAGLTAQLTLDGADRAWGTVYDGYSSGDTVELDENSTDTNALCRIVDQKLTSPAEHALAHEATLAAGVNSFTITNYVTCDARLTLVKDVSGNAETGGTAAPGDWTLTATAAGHPGIADGTSGTASATAIVSPNVEYTLEESGGPAGYQQTSVMCSTTGTDVWTVVAGTITVAPQGDLTCKFTNAAVAPQLQLKKTVTGSVVDADNWTLTAENSSGVVVNSGDGFAAYQTVRANTQYTLSETPVSGFETEATEFTASDWVCTITDGPGSPGTLSMVDGRKVTLALGQKVECGIVNTLAALPPTFTKDAGTATANADGTWDLSYTLTVTNPSAVADLAYDLVDSPDLPSGVTGVSAAVSLGSSPVAIEAWAGGDIRIADDATLAAGADPAVYTVTLTVRIPSSTPAADLLCDQDGNGFDNAATLTPVGGTPITDDACVSVVLPTVTHTKSVTSSNQNADGTWTVGYQVTVTASGDGVALYDLSDTPKLGAGITQAGAASATGPAGSLAASWNGTGSTALATAMPITSAAPHVYTVTLVVDVAAGFTGTAAADCALDQGETGTGFLNVATLTAAGADAEKTACASPAMPSFDKTFSSAVQNPDGSWAVTYTLRATNDSDSALHYSLSDTPGFATGITIDDRSVALTSVSPSQAIAWNGADPIVEDRLLAADTQDVFTVTFTATVLPGISAGDLECSDPAASGSGFFNAAILTSGNDELTDTACGPVTEAIVPTVTKTLRDGYPQQLAGGDWKVVYDIAVSTPEDNTLVATYDLSDELRFGAGFTISDSSIASADGVTVETGWTGLAGHTAVATGVTLPAKTTHHYTVTVLASLAEGAATGTSALCAADEASNGGFLNTVRATSGDLFSEDSACGEPAVPAFTKTTVGQPTVDAAGVWTVRYLLTAANDSDLLLNYSLSDELAFPTGFQITSAAVTGPGANTGWDGAADTVVTTDRALQPGTADEFEVTVAAIVTAAASLDDVLCTSEPGNGFFNGATLTLGAESIDDAACADAPLASLTLVKVVDNSAFDGVDAPGIRFGTDQDWVLTATGTDAETSGKTGATEVTNVLVPAGDYALTEAVDPASTNESLLLYTAGEWTCEGETGATVTLVAGASATCTIVNTITPLDLPTLPFDPPTLAFTGAPVTGGLVGGVALLGAGLLFLAIRRRRAA